PSKSSQKSRRFEPDHRLGSLSVPARRRPLALTLALTGESAPHSGMRIASRLVTSPVLRPIVRRPPERRACSILQPRPMPASRPPAEPTRLDGEPRLTLDPRAGEIATIVWATGFRPDYSWLQVPVLDRRGRLRHDGGVVTGAPGMYAIGLNLLRRRKSR